MWIPPRQVRKQGRKEWLRGDRQRGQKNVGKDGLEGDRQRGQKNAGKDGLEETDRGQKNTGKDGLEETDRGDRRTRGRWVWFCGDQCGCGESLMSSEV